MNLEYFDHIYLVNLPQHGGRRLRALSHLSSFGIHPTVFEASNGYLPPLLNKYHKYSNQEPGSLIYFSQFNKVERNRRKRFIESPGAYGYINTYIRILEHARSKGYRSILIFEDDVMLSKNFTTRLSDLMLSLPENWKFISLGASQYNWNSVNVKKAKLQGFYAPKQLDTCGSFAIVINESIYDELIELQQYYEAPFDHLPLGEIYNKHLGKCFVAYPNIVMPDVRSSSIRGSRHQLNHAKNMKWDPSIFEYPPKRPIINLILTSKEQVKYLDSFNDENTFPFELHLFIPSLDGLRPFHNMTQPIEDFMSWGSISSPNVGFCVRSTSYMPITEDGLIELYESLVENKQATEKFEIITTNISRVDKNRVSIIIPTYRRSDNLKKVLLSVIEQDYDNKEIIVVDDNHNGSKDQLTTEDVVLGMIKQFPNTSIRYISHSRNRNGAGARNTGFFKSTGNYICFLDDDDLYLPGRLSKSINKLKKTPDYIGAVYCGFLGWNGAANKNKRYERSNLTQELLSLDYLSHYLHTNTVTYKRVAINTINGFDETFLRHQDLEFNIRFFEYYDMATVREQLVSLRPEQTVINNQQFGLDLFETKLKFLKKFQYIINRFDVSSKKNIYDRHWAEVVNYVTDEIQFKRFLLSEFSSGYMQCFDMLKKNQKNSKVKTSEKVVTTSLMNKRSQGDVEKPIINSPILLSEYGDSLNYWQQKGVNFFSFAFSRFIDPPHKNKLKYNPKAFFVDSKHPFTRFVGRILRFF